MKFAYVIFAALLVTVPAYAIDDSHMHAPRQALVGDRDPNVAVAEGILNRVDPGLGLVNMTHAAIPEFGWPLMTMDLKLEQKALAAGLQPGMKVKFKLRRLTPVSYVIIAITPVQ